MQVMIGRTTVAGGQGDFCSVAKHSGIAHTNFQRGLDFNARRFIFPIEVESPGMGVERIHVVAPGTLLLRNL